MIRANVTEDDEQTMARFLNGLNHPIMKIADFQPYSNLIELVHQETKAERQVQDDLKYARTHPRHTASTTIKLQQLLQHLRQPSLLQATITRHHTRILHQVQVVFLLLQATTSRVLLPQLRPMRPSRQVHSSASHVAAEATSPSSVPTSEP